ncbi:Peptidase S1, PA clan [Sesbania bispinosa]|nr:Peptidase S1, PA clan [Sesbania bispinosa]
MHDSGENSIARLEWNSSPEPFNFGSFGPSSPAPSTLQHLKEISDSFEIIVVLEERPHSHHFFAKKECVLLQIESEDIVLAFEEKQIEGMEIARPDLFNNDMVVVHGHQGFASSLSLFSYKVQGMTSFSFPFHSNHRSGPETMGIIFLMKTKLGLTSTFFLVVEIWFIGILLKIVDLFNEDDFGMSSLWLLPPGTQAGPGFQLFGSNADMSDALVHLQHINCTSSLKSCGCFGKDIIANVVAKVGPTVVNIAVPQDFYGVITGRSIGSGTIINKDGTILTCAHVVVDFQGTRSSSKGKIEVTLQDRRTFEGKLVNANLHSDIAIVKINSETPLPEAKLGSSSKSDLGPKLDFTLDTYESKNTTVESTPPVCCSPRLPVGAAVVISPFMLLLADFLIDQSGAFIFV